jgi:hypothetical protein
MDTPLADDARTLPQIPAHHVAASRMPSGAAPVPLTDWPHRSRRPPGARHIALRTPAIYR